MDSRDAIRVDIAGMISLKIRLMSSLTSLSAWACVFVVTITVEAGTGVVLATGGGAVHVILTSSNMIQPHAAEIEASPSTCELAVATNARDSKPHRRFHERCWLWVTTKRSSWSISATAVSAVPKAEQLACAEYLKRRIGHNHRIASTSQHPNSMHKWHSVLHGACGIV